MCLENFIYSSETVICDSKHDHGTKQNQLDRWVL